MENQFSQERLDALIERHLDKKGNKILKLFTEGEKTASYTELSDKFLNIKELERVVFKRSYVTRILNTVFGLGLITGISIATFQGAPALIFYMGLFSGGAIVIKAWFIGDKNTIQIDRFGVTYNDMPYEWNIIEKTVILTEFRGKHEPPYVYLVLALKTGKNKILEATDLELRKSPGVDLRNLMRWNVQGISHFIEYFKQQA